MHLFEGRFLPACWFAPFGRSDGLDKDEMQVVEVLKAMDINGDNEISIKELVEMGHVMRKTKEETARLRRLVTGVVALSAFFLGLLLCMVVAGVEATKENHTAKKHGSPTFVDNDGNVIGTAVARYVGPLRSDLPFDTLAGMSTLRLVSEPGNVTHFFKISGFQRDPTGLLTLYTHQGLASTLYVKDDEVWMTGEKGAKIVLRKRGRRLLADEAALASDNTGDLHGGGCNGEAKPGTPCTAVTSPRRAPAVTNGMCICKDKWEYVSDVFSGGVCANPDGDPAGSWCIVENDPDGTYGGISNCRPSGNGTAGAWDYCRTSPVTHTKAKCACHAEWTFGNQKFGGHCATPDGDATPWCLTVEGSCANSPAGVGWDYCDPPQASFNAAQALTDLAPTPANAAAPTCDSNKCCEPSAPMKKAKWTFLVYGVSDNNLEPFMGHDLKEMAQAGFGASEDVNMIVIADRARTGRDSRSHDDEPWLNQAPFHTMKTFYVADGQITCLKDHGEGDMSKVQTFTNFTSFAISKFPAEKYGVIFWNHGMGWLGFGSDQTPGATAGSTHFASMDLPHLEKSLTDALASASLPKFDLVGFDASLMGSVSVVSKLAKFADVLLISEDLQPGYGWDYTAFKDVVKSPDLSPIEVAKKIIFGFQASYETNQLSPVTLTALLTSKWSAFEAKWLRLLDEFTKKVLNPEGVLLSCQQVNGIQTFLQAVNGDEVQKLGGLVDMWVDVGNLIAAMKKSATAPESPQPALATLADEALAALTAMQPAPMAKSSDRAQTTGLGVLFPSPDDVKEFGLSRFTEVKTYGPLANFSAHAAAAYDAFLREAYQAGSRVAAALDDPSFTAAGLKFKVPNGMIPSTFLYYRNGMNTVKIGCVVEDATASEKTSCGDYTIDKWTNNPVAIDIALAWHTHDLRTIPKASCFYLRTFDKSDPKCPPAYMLKGETNSKALVGFTSYYGVTSGTSIHVYGALLPGASFGPTIGPIDGSTTQGPILKGKKDPDTCNGRTMSSAPNHGARADWDGVSYHLEQRKYVVSRDTANNAVYGSGQMVTEEAPGYAESSYKVSLLGWTDGTGTTQTGDTTELVTKVTKLHVAYYPDGNPTCVDVDPFCSQFAAHGQCKNPQFDPNRCAKSCNVCKDEYYDAYIQIKEEPKLPPGCIVSGGKHYCPKPTSGRLDYSDQTVSTALYVKLPGQDFAEMSRKEGTGFVPYVYTSSSNDPDDNVTLGGGLNAWYKDFRLSHGTFFHWDKDSEVTLRRKLRASELGIGSGRGVLFGVALDADNRRAVLTSWKKGYVASVAPTAGRRRTLGEEMRERGWDDDRATDAALLAARDKMEERTLRSTMAPVTPRRGDKHRAYIDGHTVATEGKQKDLAPLGV